MKKYYFISGLPRSGNTLLASLLNQNPKIHTTGHAWTTDLMFSLKSYLFHDTERCQNYPNHFAIQNIYKKMFDTFYYNVDKPYILERGDWMTPFNYQMIKQFCPNEVKIVILVRDILDIIKSYLKLCDQYPDFFINDNYNRLDKTTVFKSEIEENGDYQSATNSYGGTSDQRLKENIVASGSQWDDIKALQIKKYSMIEDGLDAPDKLGVIAQDLQASGMNGLVKQHFKTDDEDNPILDADGNQEEYLSVKYSVLYMKSIKALQEAMAKIETLEAENISIKARLDALEAG